MPTPESPTEHLSAFSRIEGDQKLSDATESRGVGGASLRRWIFWLALLVVVTVIFRLVRGHLDQAHVAILYLLLVLLGSGHGGRMLGLTLAALCFAFIDYYFQFPYDTLSVGGGVDWVTLVAFLATATVATNLLVRAREEAAEARLRTDEARTMSILGTETLRHPNPASALHAIVTLIQRNVDVTECTVWPWSADDGLSSQSYTSTRDVPDTAPRDATAAVGSPDTSAFLSTAVNDAPQGVRANGELLTARSSSVEAISALLASAPVALLVPLRIDQRVVGVVAISNDGPLRLDAAQERLLTALSYYAAVAIERDNLAVAASHAAALREANRLKDIVLASVSHDLRTPLTTIKALAQTGAMQGNALDVIIEEQADRLTRLVDDLLELSRLRGHELPMDLQTNTAEDLIGAAVRQTQGILNGKRIQVQLDLNERALTGRFDFVHALRSLGNLLENAVRYTPDSGVIDLAATRDGRWLRISVADRGPGVPASESAAIFELFYRRAGGQPDTGHAGMGLAIALQLAEAQEGTVSHAPREGGGSIFTLVLPTEDIDWPTE
jgi:two-component system sensor histidine kinase KdpD